MRAALRVACWVVLGYGGLCLVLFLMQDRIIFPATRDVYRDPGAFGWEFDDLYFDLDDGERTHAWFIPRENARGVALFSHGNAGNIADRLESIGLLREFDFSVLVYDYGGYGNSTGRPSERRCNADIRAAWRHLTEERGIAPSEIVLFGRSLGAAPSIDLAREVEAAALIVESAFTSTVDIARETFPYLPVRWFVRHRFENARKIRDAQSPVLVIHSPDDTLIPFHHGQALYENAPDPKAFVEIRGDHNEGFVLSRDVYTPGWETFLAPILPRPAAD